MKDSYHHDLWRALALGVVLLPACDGVDATVVDQGRASAPLVVEQDTSHQDVVWSAADKLSLTYCVSAKFGAWQGDVVQAMSTAALAWMQAANVKFTHVATADQSCDALSTSARFWVVPFMEFPNGAAAKAFFPNEPPSSRYLQIDEATAKQGGIPLANILTHELGHVLGFRHEQVNGGSNSWDCDESASDPTWRPVTAADADSVMYTPQCHADNYFSAMSLSASDREGAAAVYGAPEGIPVLLNGNRMAVTGTTQSSGEVFVPARLFLEALGYEVGWQNGQLTIAGKTVIVATQNVEGNLWAPVRALADQVGLTTTWDSPTRRVLITANALIEGWVRPDFDFRKSSSVAPYLLGGFRVEVVGAGKYTLTDRAGHFRLAANLTGTAGTLKISKTSWLTRSISNVRWTGPTVGTRGAPVPMWAGDLDSDGVINMKDVVRLAVRFNTTSDGSVEADIDHDGAVNMSDVVIIAEHFNTSSADYPPFSP